MSTFGMRSGVSPLVSRHCFRMDFPVHVLMPDEQQFTREADACRSPVKQ